MNQDNSIEERLIKLKKQVNQMTNQIDKIQKQIQNSYDDDSTIISFAEKLNKSLQECYSNVENSFNKKRIPEKFRQYYLSKINKVINSETAYSMNNSISSLKKKNQENILEMEETVRQYKQRICDLQDEIRLLESQKMIL